MSLQYTLTPDVTLYGMYTCSYLSLTVTLNLHVPDNGTCGDRQVAECSARDFNQLEIKLDGYGADTFFQNTIRNDSIGPVNITRCDKPMDQFRLCLTYVAGEAVNGLQITCSANGKGLMHWSNHCCFNSSILYPSSCSDKYQSLYRGK